MEDFRYAGHEKAASGTFHFSRFTFHSLSSAVAGVTAGIRRLDL
jgi:hypothetical protein